MNAIHSANTLPWRESASFNPAITMDCADPMKVYEFMGRSTFDSAFRRQLAETPREAFGEYGFGDLATAQLYGDLDRKLALDDDEQAVLDELTQIVHANGKVLVETEKTTIRAGYGMPALAILVLVVAVALWVVVVSPPHQDQ